MSVESVNISCTSLISGRSSANIRASPLMPKSAAGGAMESEKSNEYCLCWCIHQ